MEKVLVVFIHVVDFKICKTIYLFFRIQNNRRKLEFMISGILVQISKDLVN